MIGKILIVAALAITAAGSTWAADARHCVALHTKRGEHCGDPSSISVDVVNRCNQPVYVKVCNQRTNGQWDCGSDSNLAPGKRNTGFWSCKATGRYEWAACTGGYKECNFKP